MTEVTKKKSKIVPIIIALVAVLAILAVVLLTVTGSESSKISRKMAKAEKYVLALEYEKAIDLYEQVLEINPKYLDAYLGLADVYMEMDKPEKAAKILEKALKKIKDSDDIEAINEKMREISGPVSEDITDDPGVTEVTTSVVEEEVEEEPLTEEENETTASERDRWKLISVEEDGVPYLTYEYDETGKLLSERHFRDSGLYAYTEYTYHENGNIGSKTEYEYGDYQEVYNFEGFIPFDTYYYDENGLCIRHDSYWAAYYFFHDDISVYDYVNEVNDMGLIEKTYVYSGSDLLNVDCHEYDEYGNETAVYILNSKGEIIEYEDRYYREYEEVNGKFCVSSERHVVYRYYDGGDIEDIDETTFYEYDDRGNCVKENNGESTTEYFYDEYGNLSNVKKTFGLDIEYTYENPSFSGEPGDYTTVTVNEGGYYESVYVYKKY